VEINRDTAVYRLMSGSEVRTVHHGEPVTITADAPVTRDIPPAPERPAPANHPGRHLLTGKVTTRTDNGAV
jgi:alpha,alpha-trehalose phosphorylase